MPVPGHMPPGRVELPGTLISCGVQSTATFTSKQKAALRCGDLGECISTLGCLVWGGFGINPKQLGRDVGRLKASLCGAQAGEAQDEGDTCS